MAQQNSSNYVSRGGEKLAHALQQFSFSVDGLSCADLGSHVGGFVDCLLQGGASRVYSIDTAYGTLAWTLRKDDRVVVMERTNAMHAELPERVDLVTVDAGWTIQSKILPNAELMLKMGGHVITLIKPHYEAPKNLLQKGVLPDDQTDGVLTRVREEMISMGWEILNTTISPIRGHGGNREILALLTR